MAPLGHQQRCGAIVGPCVDVRPAVEQDFGRRPGIGRHRPMQLRQPRTVGGPDVRPAVEQRAQRPGGVLPRRRMQRRGAVVGVRMDVGPVVEQHCGHQGALDRGGVARASWSRLRQAAPPATRRAPPDGTTPWSCRRLAAHFGVGKDIVQRVRREADLRPHRLARYVASNDPDFETKAADIIALYLDPPSHAAVFCIDEKTAIQALDGRDRVLPLSPGCVERHGLEYKRHGTLSLYAALNVRTGEVLGKRRRPGTPAGPFVAFLGEVVATREPDEEIHVILDNLSAHKRKLVEAFLDAHPNVTLHFTPTYSSWLNRVELWFSKVQRTLLSRGIFTSTADLARKPRPNINAYAKGAKPFRWKYANPARRIPRA